MLSKTFLSASLIVSAISVAPAGATTYMHPACTSIAPTHKIPARPRPGFKQEIPYRSAHNYFVNNTVTGNHSMIIRTRQEFDRYFGGAATMRALPTPINFEKEGVVAVIAGETNHVTGMRAVKLTRQHKGELLLTYRQRTNKVQQSYTTRPFLLLIVDKDMLADNSLRVKKVK